MSEPDGKKLLVIGAGPAQAQGIAYARSMGCKVVAIDGSDHAPGLKIADVGIVADVKDVERAVAIARLHRVDGVLTIASEICLRTVAAVNHALGLPGMTPDEAALVTDKGAMRRRYEVGGVPSTAFFVFDRADQVAAACRAIGFPAVLKPVDNAGSRGVRYVEDAGQVALRFEEARRYSTSGRVLLERFMPGVEVSAEAFVVGGAIHILTLSDKTRTSPPYLLDTAVMFPSAHPHEVQRAIRDVATRAIRALRIDNCPVHMELMVTPDGPKVVELAGRGPGFRVYTDIIPYVTGVNGVEAQVRLLLGETPRLVPRAKLKGACIRFWGGTPGRLKRVTGIDEARAVAGVYDLDVYVKPGDEIRELTSGSDRIGHVIALADTRDEACRVADEAFGRLCFEMA